MNQTAESVRERIKQWIKEHEGEMLADLGRLVKHNSVSKEEEGSRYPYGIGCAAALDEFLDIGKGYGFTTENAEYHVGVLKYDNGGHSIGLWAHLDIVPDNGEWVYPPFEVTRKGDFLIGRGVSDNKGPAVISLYAMRCIRDLGLPFKSSIQVFGGCAEETSMNDVIYYAKNYKTPDYNIVADAGFPVCYAEKGVLEVVFASPQLSGSVIGLKGGTVSNIVPDYAEITLTDIDFKTGKLLENIAMERGEGTLTLSAKGIARHSAAPEGSKNAVHLLLDAVISAGILSNEDSRALDFIRDICAVYDGSPLGINCSDDISGELTCVGSIVELDGNKAKLTINVRYPVTKEYEWLMEQISPAADMAGYTVLPTKDNKPNHVDKDSFFVKALTDAYNKVAGDDKQPYVMGGGTYARKLPKAVAFGPGLPYDHSGLGLPEGHGLYHCPDESCSVDNMLRGLEIYVMSLLELVGQIGK